MRKNKETTGSREQLNLFDLFDKNANRCDRSIKALILEAQNVRYLITKIHNSGLKPRVKAFWEDDLQELLDLYSDLCESIATKSTVYYRWDFNQFDKLWKYNKDITSNYCTETPDILSHHTATLNRLKAAILSQSPCFKDSGPIIDKIQKKILLHQSLFTSYTL